MLSLLGDAPLLFLLDDAGALLFAELEGQQLIFDLLFDVFEEI